MFCCVRMRYSRWIWSVGGWLALLLIAVGCNVESTDSESEVVVESYLIANDTLPQVRLMQSVAATDRFDPEDAAVRNADVVVRKLDGEENAAMAYPYEEDTPGVYRPVDNDVVVQPGARYALEVDTETGERVEAETLVPDLINVQEVENTEVPYQGPDQPSFVISESQETERPRAYAFAVTSQLDFDALSDEELIAELTPFYADSFDEDDDRIGDLQRVASPLVNEQSFQFQDDGSILIEVPWIGFAFYGDNNVAIVAPDESYYDLIRTQDVQQGGLSPGEIPNVIDRVEGGTGIFGSLSRASAIVTIERPEGIPSSTPVSQAAPTKTSLDHR